jgi:isochorismate pyruvate lyase
MKFRRTFSGAPWEDKVGYCRALRADNQIFISRTGLFTRRGDAEAQTRHCFEIIARALKELGAGLEHVTRTRMFVTDISRWEEFGRAHRAFFENHPPATTMVEVKSLVHPDMLIEIEADAYVHYVP